MLAWIAGAEHPHPHWALSMWRMHLLLSCHWSQPWFGSVTSERLILICVGIWIPRMLLIGAFLEFLIQHPLILRISDCSWCLKCRIWKNLSLSLSRSLDSAILWVFSAFSAALQELWVISSSAEINNRGELQFSDFTSGTRSKKGPSLNLHKDPNQWHWQMCQGFSQSCFTSQWPELCWHWWWKLNLNDDTVR